MSKPNEKQKVLIVDSSSVDAKAIKQLLSNAQIECEIVTLEEFYLQKREGISFEIPEMLIENHKLSEGSLWYKKFAGKNGKPPKY